MSFNSISKFVKINKIGIKESKGVEELNSGKLFKSIRENKGYSQRYMAKNILNQSSYSKFEKRSIDLATSKYVHLLEKLDMEHEEFQFITNNYTF